MQPQRNAIIYTLPKAISSLPVLALAGDIDSALGDGNVILKAQPGAGKSTGLPLALLLGGKIDGKIIMLEPRRLAARAVAERLASHFDEKVGQRIGLRMRADTRVSSATQLEVVTEGVLTRILQQDPTLEGVALVIFDEFHERSLHADLGLALCLEVQQALRTDLRLLLMSATLDTQLINAVLGDATEFDCPVKQHPVDVVFLGESFDHLPQQVVRAVLSAIDQHTGDILVFLPGVAEIKRSARLLSERLDKSSTQLLELHSGVSSQAQRDATAPSLAGPRRVILTTSLAETSITIVGVTVVIDSGLERRGRIDISTSAQLLETVAASQASAAQRAGRAGRTAPGVCYRLWSEEGHVRRPANWQPEILRAELSSLVLEAGLWGAGNVQELPWLDAPPVAALAKAEELLVSLGIWVEGRLSAYGRIVATLPVHPRLGHMLIWAAKRGEPELACTAAVWLQEQRSMPGVIDIDSMVKTPLPDHLKRRAEQLEKLVSRHVPKNVDSRPAPSLGVILAQSYPDWIAMRRPGEPGRFVLACGAGVTLHEEDPLAHCRWLVAVQLGGAARLARIFKAVALDINELRLHSPEMFANVDHLDWDNARQRVLGEHRLMIGHLLVNTRQMQNVSNTDKALGLLVGIRAQGTECLPWSDESREWQARVQRMRELSASLPVGDWPDVSDEALLSSVNHWLLPFLSGMGSMKALRQLDLLKILKAMLDYRQQSLLDEWLPQRYNVPSGSSIKLTYTSPGNPVLSVKLQEMLGCADNPSIAKGNIVLKVELLSPARRPVQITEDLATFWTSSYPAVKKEMAGRYPRHHWPDDPLVAQATARAKPRKQR
ncbi:MAG: ATP-dependent helicase HrpB [Granulosicoccus sp.]